MELHRDQRYDIAWILSSIDHHVVATQFFDKISHRYTSTSSNIAFTLGRVGLHNVVAVSIACKDTSRSFAGNIVDSLLQEFPSIRAGFLISANGTVPRNGTVRVGDVVLGLESSMKSGVVYFDHQETTNQKRLFMTNQAQHLPGAVLTAANNLRSHHGRNDWLRRLEQNWPVGIPYPTVCRGGNRELHDIHLTAPEEIDNADDTSREPALNYEFWRGIPLQRQPKAFSGMIASSEQMLEDPPLIDSIATSNGILCFETAAANIKSRPFMVVSGVASCSGDTQQDLPSNEVCKVVASYVTSLVHLIDPIKLATEFPIGNYFEYETFDLDRPGFRLLRLESGPGPIKCHVFQAYLDDEASLIPYEALSYCWGSNLLTSTITVNEKVLFITENLAEALQNLRVMDEDRILWIDSICVDQSNIPERGHQVVCMSQIYNRADRVLIWLGFVNHDLSHLISALKRFEAAVDRKHPGAWRNWSYSDPRWFDVWENTETYLRGGHESDRISQQSRLRLLMSKPWFGRVWILQEVARAKKARLGCTEGWISSGSFALAPRLLGVAPDTQCQAIIDIMPGPSRRSSWWTEKQNLCTLLWRFRGSQATDPRDRLYALLDLASDTKIKERITADYTKNEEAVVKDILAYLFNNDLSSNDFIARKIADLQEKIPNLSCASLERMILGGARIKDIQRFLRLQNKTVLVSETAASYAWCVSTTLRDFLMKEPTFEHVLIGPIFATNSLKDAISVESFFNTKKKVRLTHDAFWAARQNGIDPLTLVVKESRHDIEITEELVEEAARMGPDTLKLLLDKRGEEVRITEALVEEAARIGSDVLNILLDRRGKDLKITRYIIQIAHKNGIDLKALVLQQIQGNIEITGALVEEAARMGSDTLKLLLDKRGDEVRITEALVKEAARSGSDTLKLLLDRRGDEVRITEALVEEAAQSGSDTFKLLLDRRGKDIKVTRNIIQIARKNGINVPELVMEATGEVIEITEALVEEAARIGSDMLKLLLDRRGDEVRITEALVKEAARSGSDTFKLLLDRRGKDIKITRNIVRIARKIGINVPELVMEATGEDIEITEAVVEEAARIGSDMLNILLDRRGKDLKITRYIIQIARENGIDLLALAMEGSQVNMKITEALVEEAARVGSDTLKLLLDKRSDEVRITEALVKVVAWSGSDTFKLLLDRSGDEVKVTEALVRVVARTGSDTLKLLLDRRGDEVKITEALVKVVVRTGSDTFKLLLDRSGDEVKVTEALVKEAAWSGSDTFKLLLDRRGDEVKITLLNSVQP